MRILLAVPLLLCACAVQPESDPLEYREGDAVLEGELALPDGEGQHPGVLVVHAWMGQGEHERDSARRLAGMGYVALAVDLYGRDVRPTDRKEASQVAGRFRGGDRALMRARLKAAHDALLATGRVDPRRVGAIGYCFGGTAVLELARMGADVKGVVSFHGGLSRGQGRSVDRIGPRILVLHGADDPHVDPEEVGAFKEEIKGADMTFVAYSGAVHSFANPKAGNDPSRGAAYHEEAARRSWVVMTEFFNDLFRP